MPPRRRPPKPRPAEARRPLKRAAADYKRRSKELDRERAQVRRDRDHAIQEAYREGLTLVDIAKIVEHSHQWVSRIVRRDHS
jgi:hypothetical protein